MSESVDAVRNLVNSIRAASRLPRIGEEYDQSERKCPLCGGTFWRWLGRDKDQYSWVTTCGCAEAEKAKRAIDASGLSELLAVYTFDSFMTHDPFQKQMARTVAAFVDAVLKNETPWMFVGGQSGCGKTHICTAACGKLLEEHLAVKYMRWVSESRALKAVVMDKPVFETTIKPYQQAAILYIDDLLKEGGGTKPTPAELTLAFDLIDSRLIQNKPTIISSEWTMDELLSFDQATFGRVSQKAKGYLLNIASDIAKNYRLDRKEN